MHFVRESLCIKGEKKEGYSVQEENLSLHEFVQGELALMLWELFVSPESSFCFALLPFVLSPFASP
jgi:hypothetical protein